MADGDDGPILILVTAGGRNDAERLGESLVVERLAASCSVIPTVHSFYFSDDLIQRDHEALLMVRTVASMRASVLEHVEKNHDYPRREVLEIEVTGGSLRYLDWLSGQVAKPDLNR